MFICVTQHWKANERFNCGMTNRRTLERRVQSWKLQHGVELDVKSPQTHHAGDVTAFLLTKYSGRTRSQGAGRIIIESRATLFALPTR
ncbi:MAG: hypothetical protein ACI9G1_002717 [Pirellulaceae bacterium]